MKVLVSLSLAFARTRSKFSFLVFLLYGVERVDLSPHSAFVYLFLQKLLVLTISEL